MQERYVHLGGCNHTATRSGGGDHMLRSELEESANWIMKFVGVSAAMSVLASCAVAVPLRPLATSLHGRGEGDLTCTADSRCSYGNGDRQAAYRRLQPVVRLTTNHLILS